MGNKEMLREAARKKAEALRWKKPLVKELNLEEMRYNLGEMLEACGNIIWYQAKDFDELEEVMGEDEAHEFQGSFSALSTDIERILDQFADIWVPGYFDDFMAAVHPDGQELDGYDSYEEDYFRLDTWQIEHACREAKERIQRKTKSEIIDAAHVVIGILCQYMAVKYRFDSLSAVFDVLMERSEKELRAVKEIEDAYIAAEAAGFAEYDTGTRRLDRLLSVLPDRMWLE
ncbi:MAG: hypothetical protein IKI84_11365 [Clostridia bacterium]|nr:hypothetical protein [Clostridia bacterium]